MCNGRVKVHVIELAGKRRAVQVFVVFFFYLFIFYEPLRRNFTFKRRARVFTLDRRRRRRRRLHYQYARRRYRRARIMCARGRLGERNARASERDDRSVYGRVVVGERESESEPMFTLHGERE